MSGAELPLHEMAQAADQRSDWRESERLWRAFVAQQDHVWWAYASLANAVRAQERVEDADAILEDAIARLPGEAGLLGAFAAAAERRGDWPEALRRWKLTQLRCGGFGDAHLGLARAARELGREEDAIAEVRAGAELFPEHTGLLHDLARIEERQGDWPAAERTWRRFLAVDTGFYWAHTGLAHALREQGQIGEATRALMEAIDHFPTNSLALAAVVDQISRPGMKLDAHSLARIEALLATAVERSDASTHLTTAYALIARERGQWMEFRRRLEAARDRAPDDLRIRVLLAEAAELAAADEFTPSTKAAAPKAADLDDIRLVASFESLGGGRGTRGDDGPGGCEFGLFQRAIGVEPLSLLRWATIEPPDLRRVLANRFDELGSPDAVELRAQGHYDWQFVETNYRMRVDHTHLDRSKIGADEAKRMVVARFSILKRKLIEDLTAGEKIFVYRYAGGILSMNEIEDIVELLNSFGPTTLLFVTHDSTVRDAFRGRRVHERLLLAEIAGSSPGVDVPAWLEVCRFARRECPPR